MIDCIKFGKKIKYNPRNKFRTSIRPSKKYFRRTYTSMKIIKQTIWTMVNGKVNSNAENHLGSVYNSP